LAGNGRAVDVEDGGRLLLLAGHDLDQSVALRGRGALIDKTLGDAAAFVNRTRPAVARGDDRAIEANIAEIAFVDAMGFHALADPIGRPRVELTWTAIGAIAGADFRSRDHPIQMRHRRCSLGFKTRGPMMPSETDALRVHRE